MKLYLGCVSKLNSAISKQEASGVISSELSKTRLGKTQCVVPIYNEGENVKVLYNSLISENVPFDSLTFIYDIDADTSLPFIAEIGESDGRVSAKKNTFGRGVINALRFGFKNAEPGPVIVMMGDNSDKLSIVPEMISLWSSGAVLVSPSRYMPGGKQHGGPPLKSFLSMISGRVIGFLGFPTNDPTNNFKLYDGQWLAAQDIESVGGFEVALELSFKAHSQGKTIKQLPTEWWDRTEGESNFQLWAWLPKYLYWYLLAMSSIFLAKNPSKR